MPDRTRRQCRIVDLDDLPATHDGVVVVLDVIRAFTSAAVALAAGAVEILCVESLDAAHALRAAQPGVLLMGEEHGQRPDGFDFGNSPDELARAAARLEGRVLVQRTSNGTRGLARASAPVILAAAATNASATVAHVERHHRALDVLLVCTGETREDRACAEFMVDLLEQERADVDVLTAGILIGASVHEDRWRTHHGEGGVRAFRTDLAWCAAVDRHDLAMVGSRGPTGAVRLTRG